MLIHKKIKEEKIKPKFKGLGGFNQSTHEYKPLTIENLEDTFKSMSTISEENEICRYAVGWWQDAPLGFAKDSDIEWVPIFNPEFRTFINNLEKNRLLPFNFL